MNKPNGQVGDQPWTTALSRVPRSHQQAQATYDRISSWYDLLEGNWERAPKQTALQRLGVEPGDRVLEIGCGTGQSMMELARAIGSAGTVYGVDLSARMLAISRAQLAAAGLSKRTVLEQVDATQLPFRANSFDAAFMSFVLELFDTPEIPIVLSECRRVLRGGGRIGIVSLSKGGGTSWMRNAYEWGHNQFPNLLDCRPILVKAALEDAQFQVLDALLVSLWGLPVEIVLASKLE